MEIARRRSKNRQVVSQEIARTAEIIGITAILSRTHCSSAKINFDRFLGSRWATDKTSVVSPVLSAKSSAGEARKIETKSRYIKRLFDMASRNALRMRSTTESAHVSAEHWQKVQGWM